MRKGRPIQNKKVSLQILKVYMPNPNSKETVKKLEEYQKRLAEAVNQADDDNQYYSDENQQIQESATLSEQDYEQIEKYLGAAGRKEAKSKASSNKYQIEKDSSAPKRAKQKKPKVHEDFDDHQFDDIMIKNEQEQYKPDFKQYEQFEQFSEASSDQNSSHIKNEGKRSKKSNKIDKVKNQVEVKPPIPTLECEICHKFFKSNEILAHQNTEHGIPIPKMPYKCKYCGKILNRSNRKRHIKAMHPLELRDMPSAGGSGWTERAFQMDQKALQLKQELMQCMENDDNIETILKKLRQS